MVYNHDTVDDLFQEVIINIWKSISTFQGKSKIETWLYRVTVNNSITFNAKQKREHENSQNYLQEIQQSESNNSDLIDKVRLAINRLESADRAVIGLYLEGFSYKEISQHLGISVSHVGVKLNRIKLRLKEILI